MRWLAGIIALCVMGFSTIACADYSDVLLKDVPHIRQKPDFCGEACAAMWLNHLGETWSQDQVFAQSGLDPALGRGCYSRDLKTALDRIGFQTGVGWYSVPADKPDALEAQWAAVHGDLVKGIPSIVCMHYSDKPQTSEHIRLMLGYDAKTDQVIYHEPAEDKGAYVHMPRATFMQLWPLKYNTKTWTLVRMRLAAGKIAPAPKAAAGFTPADYAQHVMALKERVPAGFTILVEPPFVVIGDEPARTVASHAAGTVRWATSKLKQDYFTREPADILDIWLFRDKASYDKHTKEIFDDRPDTPYGYYSPEHKALIMNIATGGGTLVHEIVHPFMRANFPECPAWFNEGMGSLYEQSNERRGHIVGDTNWRLAGLQKAIKAETVPSFEELCGTTDAAFYGQDRGTNYAQARYLCYYLQEHGLLTDYYAAFVKNHKDDPTGYKSLQSILKVKDMDQFKKDWEKWVSELRFP